MTHSIGDGSEPRTKAEVFAVELGRKEPDTTRWGTREDGSVASFLAEAGVAWLQRSSSARSLDLGPEAPPGKEQELFARGLAQFTDGSVAAVFDSRVETAFSKDDIVRDHNGRYAGVWNGESLPALANILERVADRYPDQPKAEIFERMDIPHQSRSALSLIPEEARECVLAVDSEGNALALVGPELLESPYDPDRAMGKAASLESRELRVAHLLGSSESPIQRSLDGVQTPADFLREFASKVRDHFGGVHSAGMAATEGAAMAAG